MASKAVEQAETADLVKSDDPIVQQFMEYAQTLTAEDPDVVAERILRNLLSATTAADILGAGSVTKADELLDVPLTIHNIRASNSDFEDGPDLYLHVDATMVGNGDAITFATGARDVLIKLIRLSQLSLFPVDVVMKRATKATKGGFYPVFLYMADPADKPF